MTSIQKNDKKHAASWNIRDINGLECFRALDLSHRFRRHSHEGYTIGVIENGVGDNNYRGAVFHLSPGKIVVMNPDEVHTGIVDTEHTWSYRMFYIDQMVFRQLLPENSFLPFFRGLCFEDRSWFAALHALHSLLETGTETLAQQTCFADTLTAFAQTFGNVSASAVSGHEPKAVTRIKEFIHAHFHQNISINDLVRITQLSGPYLIRSFRRCVGIPPYMYLIQVRIKHAKALLASKLPIAEVAYEMGFSDQSHLTRHFKSITGVTPKQYTAGHCA